jgi:uncharacterized membrane protein YphA (DoxX/SURF4 family)
MAASQRPKWQITVEWTAALALAALWLAAGLWKLSDITAWQVRLTQLLFPREWSLPATLALGSAETLAAILLVAPMWRRWGAWLSGLLLSAFMLYIGYNYTALTGLDCSCFPWLKETIGPMFFVRDGALIVAAAAAGRWAAPSRGGRAAGIALAGVAVFAGAMLGVDRARNADGPASIVAEGRELSLRDGRVFIYFFNPACPHCLEAAKAMASFTWQATIVGVPTMDFDQGQGFFQDAGLSGVRLSPDLAKLRQSFSFRDVPFAVALDHGKVRERIVFFDQPQFGDTLRRIGFVL